jgi:hypothetical protein
MLQVLLHDKLNKYLIKSPYEIEDLLTSLVFGTCAYSLDGLGPAGWAPPPVHLPASPFPPAAIAE